jgi:hypothetical protein
MRAVGGLEGWDCGANGNFWGRYAMDCLPDEVWDACNDKLAFVCMAESDGRRLTKQFCEGRDIIVLSERIVPRARKSEADEGVRYFVFVILHEIAHAHSEHLPPDEISTEANDAQEAEANALAFYWFNASIREKNRAALREFTQEELERAQVKTIEAIIAARDQD